MHPEIPLGNLTPYITVTYWLISLISPEQSYSINMKGLPCVCVEIELIHRITYYNTQLFTVNLICCFVSKSTYLIENSTRFQEIIVTIGIIIENTTKRNAVVNFWWILKNKKKLIYLTTEFFYNQFFSDQRMYFFHF